MLNKLNPNGAEALAKALVDSGIQMIFGIPGVHNLVLFEALRRAGLRIIPTTHEQGAGFMANGYARATGKPGVFVMVPGPGLTNALTPITEALVDSTPMLAIVTNVPQSNRSFQMHEIKQTLLAQPVVKSVHDVESAADIVPAFHAALQETITGEPGPCILQIPSNLFWERVTLQKKRSTKAIPETAPPTEKINEIVSQIKNSKRIGLLVGLGAADALDEVRELADWLQAPVASTASGRGVMDEAHQLSLGFGWMGDAVESVNLILDSCDLVIGIGVKFSQTGTQGYRLRVKPPLIHVDASPDVPGKNYPAEVALTMDAGIFLRELLKHKKAFGPREDHKLLEMIRVEREACEKRLYSDKSTTFQVGGKECSTSEFYGALRKALPPDAILVTDAGSNEWLTLHNWTVYEPRTLINPADYESMGFAVPTAIGAALAQPKRRVVAITGDGGLVMSGLELMTAVREKINLTILVLNNEGFGIIKRIQEDFFGASVAVDVGAPDFKLLAESIHMNIMPNEGGLGLLEKAITSNLPTLLEVKMRYHDDATGSKRKKKIKNDLKQFLQKIAGTR